MEKTEKLWWTRSQAMTGLYLVSQWVVWIVHSLWWLYLQKLPILRRNGWQLVLWKESLIPVSGSLIQGEKLFVGTMGTACPTGMLTSFHAASHSLEYLQLFYPFSQLPSSSSASCQWYAGWSRYKVAIVLMSNSSYGSCWRIIDKDDIVHQWACSVTSKPLFKANTSMPPPFMFIVFPIPWP